MHIVTSGHRGRSTFRVKKSKFKVTWYLQVWWRHNFWALEPSISDENVAVEKRVGVLMHRLFNWTGFFIILNRISLRQPIPGYHLHQIFQEDSTCSTIGKLKRLLSDILCAWEGGSKLSLFQPFQFDSALGNRACRQNGFLPSARKQSCQILAGQFLYQTRKPPLNTSTNHTANFE